QWLVREEGDFDLVTIYDTYKDLFSMKVHHGGSFTPKGGREYVLEDVVMDRQPSKDDIHKKESFVRRCDLIESHVDVSETDLDVIDLDSFGIDLEYRVDSERRKILKDLMFMFKKNITITTIIISECNEVASTLS
ncbi:hypothetical protein Tco_1581182, partial [Tanacetum coccineum]